MQAQRTDSARSKEELALEEVKSGRISIDPEGRIWKHWRKFADGRTFHYQQPRRADRADKLGYCRAAIPLGHGKMVIVYAHRLVWVYHNGPIPMGRELNHKDGNKSNNRLSNLELVTRSENLTHAHHITDSFTKNGIRYTTVSKMDPEKDAEVARLRLAGESWEVIATRFGISTTSAQRAVQRHQRGIAS